MSNREFVMLAHDWNGKSHVGGMFMSEKLDGMRAIWLPFTQGMTVKDIPFANLQKDVTGNANRLATGLWSRYGNPIWAPEDFIEHLPKELCLDGELYIGRQKFQETVSIVKKKEPVESEWMNIKFMVFDMISLRFCQAGKIHNNQWKHFEFPHEETFDLMTRKPLRMTGAFVDNQRFLQGQRFWNDVIYLHFQVQLPNHNVQATQIVEQTVFGIMAGGGEGLILRDPLSYWEPIRSNKLLKVKPFKEMEAIVIGWKSGEGRLKHQMGSLLVELCDGKHPSTKMYLSGFTDEERQLGSTMEWGSLWPLHFPKETLITFRYRELTDDGIPKEARYLRKRQNE